MLVMGTVDIFTICAFSSKKRMIVARYGYVFVCVEGILRHITQEWISIDCTRVSNQNVWDSLNIPYP